MVTFYGLWVVGRQGGERGLQHPCLLLPNAPVGGALSAAIGREAAWRRRDRTRPLPLPPGRPPRHQNKQIKRVGGGVHPPHHLTLYLHHALQILYVLLAMDAMLIVW